MEIQYHVTDDGILLFATPKKSPASLHTSNIFFINWVLWVVEAFVWGAKCNSEAADLEKVFAWTVPKQKKNSDISQQGTM